MSEHDHILALLDDSDPERIREGAQLAGESKLTDAIPGLVRNITSSNIGVQEAVDRALRKIGGPEVVHAVIPLLRSDEAPARNLAMDLLRELGGSALTALAELLRDNDPDVRIFASDILGSTGSAVAVPYLCHALLNDPEVNVRYQAAVSLGQLAFPESAACLNSALEDEEWVQFSAIEALTKVRDAASVGALMKALSKASELVASIIVDAIGEMGDIKAVPLLLKRLESSPTPLGNKIVRAVLNIMGERSLSLLGTKECDRLRGYLPSALKDEDTDIQDAAVKGFAVLGGHGATTYILEHLGNLDAETASDRIALAVDALSALGHTTELDYALEHGDDFTTQVAMEVLLRVDEDRAIPQLVGVFWNKGRDLQRSIIFELAGIAGNEHQDFFLNVLEKHKDGTVLRGALLFLGQKGDPAVVLEKILPFLDHPYNDVKESALEACIALHTPEVEAYFKGLTQSEDPMQRMIGTYGLGFFDIESSADTLKAALSDESADVRKVAVESFGRACPMKDEYLELIEKKLDDENREVRMAVFDTLGLCSNDRFGKCLIMGLDDPDPWVKVRCAEALGENQIKEAVEPLINMLSSDNTLVVLKSTAALGMIGGEVAFRALMPLLDHPDPDINEAAEDAINAVHRMAEEEE
ncbi:HEAT repeat domain-containing protein [Desulfovibrio sp. OttesenSCG-928-G15]|nr:HEAT repeat domain-containing protein [Desulfovibrio sp. OttesenSCG-928-G15]